MPQCIASCLCLLGVQNKLGSKRYFDKTSQQCFIEITHLSIAHLCILHISPWLPAHHAVISNRFYGICFAIFASGLIRTGELGIPSQDPLKGTLHIGQKSMCIPCPQHQDGCHTSPHLKGLQPQPVTSSSEWLWHAGHTAAFMSRCLPEKISTHYLSRENVTFLYTHDITVASLGIVDWPYTHLYPSIYKWSSGNRFQDL